MNMVDRNNRARFEPIVGGSPEYFALKMAERSGEPVAAHRAFNAEAMADYLGLNGLRINNGRR